MIMTKAGRRTASVTALRISDTATLELTSTSMVAMPSPRALTVVLLTPSRGHKPSSCTRPGLLCHRPSAVSSESFFSATGKLLWRQLQQDLTVLAEIDERPVYRLYHRAGSDGSAGELVEVAAILADRPSLGGGYGQAFTIEIKNPVGLGQLQLVAQARGLPMVDHPHARQLAVGADTYQQIATPSVAVHGHHRQDHRADLAGVAPAPGGRGRGQPQVFPVIDRKTVIQQVVVMLVAGQGLVEGAHLHALLFGNDPLGGALLGNSDQPHGENGEQAEDQTVA